MENNQNSPNIIKQINTSIDFKRLLGEIVTHWYWFVFSLLIFLTGAFLYLRYTTPLYSIESMIMIEQQTSSPANVILNKFSSGSGEGEGNDAGPNLFNEIFLLTSQDLINAVVDSLDMNIQYFMQGRVKEDEVYEQAPIRFLFDSSGYLGATNFELRFKSISDDRFELEEAVSQQFSYNQWIQRPYGRFKIIKSPLKEANLGYLDNHTEIIIRIMPMGAASGMVSSKFNVVVSDGRTSVLKLSYTDNLPQRGLDFMHVVIYNYRLKELENMTLSAVKEKQIIDRYKKEFAAGLKSQDSAAAEIKLKNNLVDITAQTSSLLTDKALLQQTIEQLTSQKEAVRNLKEDILYGSGARGEVIAGVSVTDENIHALVIQYNALIQKMESVERNTAPLNPTYLKMKDDIDALRKQMADACDRVNSSLNVSIQNASKNLSESESVIQTLPTAEIDIADSKREYPVLTELYLYVYQRGVENEIKQYATTNKSKVVVNPYASGVPIKPVKKNIYGVMILLGLILPAAIIISRILLNNKVINENDVEAITSIPIIGAIARAEHNGQNKHIVVGPHIRTAIAEQFRLIRANLEFMSAGGNKKIYLITSSMSGEGKTFVALNLGITMTLAKKRVVIMEFDLRKPKLTNYLGLQTDGGISGYLAGLGGIASAVKPSGVHENLYVANCGPIPPNPGELLVLPAVQQLIEELSEMFDVVIMDTAPIGLVSDALILSKYSDINMFVVRQSYTIKEQLKLFDGLYREKKIKNPAILFNGVEYLKKYGYGSGYGYSSYGQGYYAEPTTKKKKSLFDVLFKK